MEEQEFEVPVEEPTTKKATKEKVKETTPTSAKKDTNGSEAIRRQSTKYKVVDKNLQEEAERAKNQLLKELNSMNIKDVNFEDVTD